MYPHSFFPKGAYAVTPSDSATNPGIGFRVAAAGNVVITDGYGSDVTFTSLAAGETVAVEFSKIKSTGTTATGIVAFRR